MQTFATYVLAKSLKSDKTTHSKFQDCIFRFKTTKCGQDHAKMDTDKSTKSNLTGRFAVICKDQTEA